MVQCCVPFCKSQSKSGSGVSFHEFPLNEQQRQAWLNATSRKNFSPNFNSRSSVVCSLHFLESDFCPGLKIRRLRPNVVPSSFPTLCPSYKLPAVKRTRRSIHKSPIPYRSKKRKHDDDLHENETQPTVSHCSDSKNIHRMEEEVTIKCEPKWSSEDSNLEDENNEEHELVPQVWVKQEIKQEPDEQEENMSDLLNEIKEIKQEPDEQEENMPDPVNECLAENENVEDGEEKKDEDATELHDVMPECETVLEEELSVSDMQLPLEIIWKEPTDIQNGIHKCQICAKVFTKKYSLQDHLKVHGEKNFQCEVCLKLFSHRSTLNKHKFVHCAERRFSCPTCGKAFKTKDNLQRHIVGHRGERNYPCSVCNKLFMHRSTLATHLETHTGDKRFQCAVCFKRFSQRTTLINHERLHTREIPYKCHMCEKGFYRRCYLVRHLRDRHQINPSTSQPFKELPTPRLDEIYTTRD